MTAMPVSLIRLTRLAAAAALLFTISLPAYAGDAAKETSVAAQHAGFAASATELSTAHAHLQHTVNCLVGSNGKGFDAKQLNPCNGFGNGAIPDTTDAAKKETLERALSKAEDGLASKDLTTATQAAASAQAALKGAM
jgi:hypothetical protein